MSGKIEARLAELGITLPVPAVPVANYVPYAVTGNLVYTSGQVPVADGAVVWKGKVGGDGWFRYRFSNSRNFGVN